MGWSYGQDIFDPVAESILFADLSDKSKVKMLTVLIKALYHQDWDTEPDSSFIDNKLVRKAFVKLNPYLFDETV
jgi:hypothetical protein